MSSNQLSGETSPYLLQHKDNPVHWRPWGSQALDEAKSTGKPILLSVGYSACHWCHVMAHESFENSSIAEVMNELFVNIKVDREERPDVDIVYQTALALLGEQGGWPLTMFLTPEGDPFWGGTYFPSTSRYGRPAFADVLRRVAQIHRDEKDKVAQNADALKDAMARMAQPPSGGGLDRTALDATAEAALSVVDPVNGGTHGAPKFPQPSFFRFLWRSYRRTSDIRLRDAVTKTLDAICQGGIYDHLGGGFARYSTDADWLVPHFEKMLYDNAQILELLAEAWQETGSQLYAMRARETVDWLCRDMRVWADNGEAGTDAPFGFTSAYDADSEGVEGQYYIWSQADIESILGDAAAPFIDAYDVTPTGNWEGVTILNRSAKPALGEAAFENGLAKSRAKLLAVRSERVPPTWDNKVLADWNGLMIAALANAGAIFGEDDWIDLARRAFDFVCRNLTIDGRLRHTWCAGSARHPAVLDDYANLSRAALSLYQATASEEYLNQAESWVAILDRRYWDAEAGGYFLTADDSHDLITRPKTVADNAVPPGNGTMVEVLARLYHLTGATAYRDRAEALVRIFSGTEVGHQINMPSLFMGFEMLDRPIQIVVVGEPAAADTQALVTVVRNAAPPIHTLSHVLPGADLPDTHPAHGMGQINGKSTAYVCVGAVCGLPSTDAGALREELARL